MSTERLAALLHEYQCVPVGNSPHYVERWCEQMAARLIAAGVRVGDDGLRAAADWWDNVKPRRGVEPDDDAMLMAASAMRDAIRAALATTGAPQRIGDALRALLREAIETVHATGSIRDHHDPTDKTGWNVHGIETCGDPLCVEALAALGPEGAKSAGSR